MGANISRYLSEGDISRVTTYNQLSIEAGSTFAGLFQYLGDSVRMGTRAWRQGELILEGSAGLSKIDTGTKTIGKIGKFDVGKWVRMPSRALIHNSFKTSQVLFCETKFRIYLAELGLSKVVNFCINFSLAFLLSTPCENSLNSFNALSNCSLITLSSVNAFLVIPRVLKLPPM